MISSSWRSRSSGVPLINLFTYEKAQMQHEKKTEDDNAASWFAEQQEQKKLQNTNTYGCVEALIDAFGQGTDKDSDLTD
jgi:hypothetical protein